MAEEEKKRGRPKGSITGPKPIIFICVGTKDNQAVSEEIIFSKTEEIDSATALAASNAFKNKHGFSPDKIYGPKYDCKSKTKSLESKVIDKKEITIPNPTLTGPKQVAEFKGWRGNAYEITGREDVVLFVSLEEINPGARTKSPPGSSVVEKTSLIFQE